MGLWGVFIGPVVACCLHVLMQIFNQELQALTLSGSLTPGLAEATVDPHLPQDEPTAAAPESAVEQAEITEPTGKSDASSIPAADGLRERDGEAPGKP